MRHGCAVVSVALLVRGVPCCAAVCAVVGKGLLCLRQASRHAGWVQHMEAMSPLLSPHQLASNSLPADETEGAAQVGRLRSLAEGHSGWAALFDIADLTGER